MRQSSVRLIVFGSWLGFWFASSIAGLVVPVFRGDNQITEAMVLADVLPSISRSNSDGPDLLRIR